MLKQLLVSGLLLSSSLAASDKLPNALTSLVQKHQGIRVSDKAVKLYELPSKLEISLTGIIGLASVFLADDAYHYNQSQADKLEARLRDNTLDAAGIRSEMARFESNQKRNICFAAAGFALCALSLFRFMQRQTCLGLTPTITITKDKLTYKDCSIKWEDVAAIKLAGEGALQALEVVGIDAADTVVISAAPEMDSLVELGMILGAAFKLWGKDQLAEKMQNAA